MDKKPRLFIYDRKEVAVLLFLGVMVAIFSFTFGVHLGKRVGPQAHHESTDPTATDVKPVETVADALPERKDLTESVKGADPVADEMMNQALRDEVARTGAKLDTPRQVELPKETRGQEAAAPVSADAAIPALTRPAPAGRFTLQIGSHQKFEEAREQVAALEAMDVKPYLRSVEIQGKGKWYRVFLGGYESKEEAEQAGARYRTQHVVDTFIVANQ